MIYTVLLLSILCLIILLFYFNKNAQLKLKKNQAKFSQLFESSNDIILILNKDLVIINSNNVGDIYLEKKGLNNSNFLDLLHDDSKKRVLKRLSNDEFPINDKTVQLIDSANITAPFSLSLVKWMEEKNIQYGVTLKDLTAKLLYESEERIISDIYKISDASEDQFSFLHQVLLTICKNYNFDYGQVWIKNKEATFYISNKFDSDKLDFKEHIQEQGNVNKTHHLFDHSDYKITALKNHNSSDFVEIPEKTYLQLKTVVSVPITHLDEVPVSFLLFSRSEDIKPESISGLFNILVLIGEINYKKTLAQELSNKHILLAEAEKIAGSGSWSINTSDFLFNHISDGFKDIYNLTTFTNLSLFAQVHPDDLSSVKTKINEAILNKVSFFLEYRIIVDQRVKYIHMRGIPKYDLNNLIIGYHGSIADVSMLKEKNIELELVNEELAALNSNLEQFTYIASHDLQEPLRKIRTFGNLLLEKYEEEAPGYQYIVRMQNASERMQKLISDLLDYSRIARSDGAKESINFNELVTEVLENFNLEGINLTVGELPTKYLGYKTQLFQLFQNLISNAIKFRKEDTQPTITVLHQTTTDNQHEITIQDNGIGFDTQYSDKIFEMFQRLHSKSEFPGTGIGLAICQKITENHDGIIKVSSNLGAGSIFKIYLPIQK